MCDIIVVMKKMIPGSLQQVASPMCSSKKSGRVRFNQYRLIRASL